MLTLSLGKMNQFLGGVIVLEIVEERVDVLLVVHKIVMV